MSEIVVVIDDKHCDDMDSVVTRLSDAGVEVAKINPNEGVIEGLVESYKVKDIDEMPGVEYVRTVFTYAADYPPGDPRDRNGR
ncbi:MAG: hypothetical protein H7Z14_00545 [Anaerolineae bacterium]|nr:hypothetical protein [Phycisphaerae bacterium]